MGCLCLRVGSLHGDVYARDGVVRVVVGIHHPSHDIYEQEESSGGGWGNSSSNGVAFCMLKRGNRGRLEAREVSEVHVFTLLGGRGMWACWMAD